ncbi:MAG: tyrosine-type recombinase/integrase [Candidatus Micrarchaeota archaeon]|nr:tyrosine-type recombinase/integrase [Candidatus Micrarchaeota archaeon]
MRNYEKSVRKHLEDPQLTKEMRDELHCFNSEFILNRGLRISTSGLLLGHICHLGRFLVKRGYTSYKQAQKQDIIDYIGTQQRKPVTMNSIKIVIRSFYSWLLTGKTTRASIKDGYPPIVDWIVLARREIPDIQPEDMIQPEEFLKLLNTCRKPRDRALLQLLYECGMRIGEALSLRIQDVHFAKDSTYINIWQSKTLARKIYIFDSIEDLKVLLNQHPLRDNPNAPLFLADRGDKVWNYHAMVCVLKWLAKKAGIKKNIHPHLFRHSRCSIDASNGISEPLAELKYGWRQGSRMFSRYSHLNSTAQRNWDAKCRGFSTEKEENHTLSKKCFRCGEFNSWTNKFCSKCGMALDKEVIAEQERFTNDIYEYIEQKFKEMEEQKTISR